MTHPHRKTIVRLSMLIGGLLALVSLVGIYVPDFYSQETLNWQIQSVAQDIIDLVLVVPALIVASLLTYSNKRAAMPLWGGILLYLVYTFAIYCFDVHFNSLFTFYCIIFGVSGYALFYSLIAHIQTNSIPSQSGNTVFRITGFYFIIISVLFSLLWLSEIIPASFNNSTPKNIADAGLPTNPVHVLDLAFVLPGVFVVGFLILKNRSLGIALAPVILTFFTLMDISIAVITVMMVRNGLEGSFLITIVMAVLAIFSLGLLTWHLHYTWTDESNIRDLSDRQLQLF